jgi:putative flippase GtrA
MLTKFIFLGAINTAVDWLWYLALTRSFLFFADHLVFAKGVAFLIGSVPLFFGNTYWVFPKNSIVSLTDQLKVYGILAAAFFINSAALSVFLAYGYNDIVAVVLATATSFMWNVAVAWAFLIKDRQKSPAPVYTPA